MTLSARNQPHLEVNDWLRNLQLSEYLTNFHKYGGVEEMLDLSERDLKDLGVKKGAHRAQMMSSLVVLKEKFIKNFKGRNVKFKNKSGMDSYGSESSLISPNFLARKLLEKKIRAQRSWPSSGTVSRRSSMEPVVSTEASAEELKKALEWELSLDNSDLRSHAWYHGTIPRQRAEELVTEEGNFLIRDCISRPGDYVLTCRWRSAPLHFVINKVILQPFTVYERIQYQFEDDCFDTVPDLVTYYVGNKRPISAASGAIISKPINRSMPLSYYASRYGVECQIHYAARTLERSATVGECNPTALGPDAQQPPLISKSPQPPNIPLKKGMPFVDPLASDGAPGIPAAMSGFATIRGHYQPSFHYSGIMRAGSDPTLSPTLDRKDTNFRTVGPLYNQQPAKEETGNTDQPPPKPSRVPSMKCAQKPLVVKKEPNVYYNENGLLHVYSELAFENENKPNLSGSGTNDTTDNTAIHDNQVPTKLSEVSPCSTIPRNQRKASETRNSFLDRQSVVPGSIPDDAFAEDKQERVPFTLPSLDNKSIFNVSDFVTLLLPSENKPLDSSVLSKVHSVLFETGPRILAAHLTKTDLDVLKHTEDFSFGLGVKSGLEMLTLPQGKQYRQDLAERIECLKFFVAVTVLSCTTKAQRSQLLNKWIQIAIETKTALGNLYGFTGIMQGLSLPQVSQLKATWLALRQSFTDNAFTYETKLRPTLKAMQECSNPLAPNTTIPYLLSLAQIVQRHAEMVEVGFENFTSEEGSKEKYKAPTLGFQWEQTAADYGLQLLLNHLEMGRQMQHQYSTFKRNSEIVLENIKYEDLVLDMFRTEFHLRFLWGSKGAFVAHQDRYSKFEQVLMVMSERCE